MTSSPLLPDLRQILARARAAAALIAALAAAALPLAAIGCGDPGADFCDAYCSCVDCSEDEQDICLAQRSAEADIASVYDCEAELQDFEDCVVTKETCPGGAFDTSVCGAEQQEYDTCKD